MTPPNDPWHLWRDAAHPAAWNMACDHVLLDEAPALGAPLLRFYAWTEPAATFGYAQRYATVETLTPLRPLVRRPTGGGVVPHDADWTYSLIAPAGHPWYDLSAQQSYERIHAWLRDAFAALDVDTSLAPISAGAERGRCFTGPERHDLVRAGRKMAGAAQRRTRTGLLIQGSVQPQTLAPLRPRWEETMAACATVHGVSWHPFQPSPALLHRIDRLAHDLYAQPHHNRRR